MCLLCAIGAPHLLSQDEYQDSVARSGERSRFLQLDELQDVVFLGCVQTTPEQLIGVISSLPSELSVTRQLTLYYEENFRRNTATPPSVLERLGSIRKDLQNELRFYDPDAARSDSIALVTYLDQNGYHHAKVNYNFEYSRETKKNTLTFTIVEGTRAIVDTLIVSGLESVDESIRKSALSATSIKSGDAFGESGIEKGVKAVINVLRDNGYYQATYEPPIIGISEDGLHDTLVVIVDPGKRVRIDTIIFAEYRGIYPSVNESTRKRQLDIDVGQWYNRRLIEQSRANLMSLGTFEIVLIDTIADDSATGKRHSTDSTVGLRIFTRNSKPYDVGANLLVYQTAVDNYLNVGVGATAQYRNTFGGAQVASVTLQYVLQDVSGFLQGQALQTEALASVVLAWPNVGRIFDQRFGLQTSTYYSIRQLVNPFRLESMGLNARSPISLHPQTFFNGVDVSVGLERQVPLNFDGALDEALKDATTPEDTAYVLSTFNQFLVLDEYLKTTGNFFTGINVGFTLRGDHRNNPINPTSGTFSSVSLEWGWGAGKYLRGQAYLSSAFPVGERLVGATKIKIGHIQLFEFVRGDSTQNNTYVPLERQFFAGGPASIRSYTSRTLHDPHSGEITGVDANQQYILSNVVGSASLIELGFELRYTFERPKGISDLWASVIERSGITFFTDIGNSFNRFTTDLYGTMRLEDLYKGSAIAVGVGYRFDTPVGPFRIDYATSFYDPTRPTGKWIYDRSHIMSTSNWQLSIGLGQAF
ncbi:MAG: BamA/TamA family outer membrane protein [Candidatus Kapabacteria bacterium]|nr:BamA/TamA family outer membrane protein [Candidatus Kapabacteria bacterium]